MSSRCFDRGSSARCRRPLALALAALLALAFGPAAAQPLAEDAELTEASRAGAADDPTFGPLLVIEAIEIAGNTSTATRVIERALPIQPGDALRAGDPRLRQTRFKVLALGYFRAVEVALRKGTARGRVIVSIAVVERGTVVLDSLFFGTSLATPWWLGAELTERNLGGSGLGVGAGFVYAAGSDIEGADAQWATRLRIGDPSILGTRFGVHASFLHAEASEPYRVAGDASDGYTGNFRAFPYSRTGGTLGMSVDLTPLSRLTTWARLEHVSAEPPLAPTWELPDGSFRAVDIHLHPGGSRVASAAIGFDRDTRADPVLPYGGDRLVLLGQLGATWMGGSYDFGSLLARYQHWWALRSVEHVVSVHLTGGVVLGDAPRFERLHVSDLNRLLTPRVLGGLVVATTPSHDLLGAGSAEVSYGEIGGSVAVEYSYRLFRSRRHVYGGDLFVGVGVWGLASSDHLRVRDRTLWRALPIDLLVDAGLRLDTEIGIFELTFANALGRVPL